MTRIRIGLLLLGFASYGLPQATARATDSLATPMSGRMVQELWPIEVSLELVRVGAGPDGRAADLAQARETDRKLEVPLPSRSVVVPDGHRLRFTSVVPTARGKRRFEIAVVPRHHPEAVEIEWDLEVHEARFRPIGWTGYVRHRLGLGQKLELGEERLKIARSDIVSTRGDNCRVQFEIDGEAFEIRMLAVTTRG